MNGHRVVFIASVIFFVAISILIYFYAPDITAHFEDDSVRYDFIAQHFNFIKEVQLEVFGYPFLLGLIYKIFGYSIGAVVVIEVLLSVGALFLLRKVSKILGGMWAETFVTLLWVGNLGFFIYSQLLLIEVVLALFYLWFIERIVSFYESPSCLKVAQAGFILGASMLFRPSALFYAFCFAVFLVLMRKRSFGYRLLSSLVFIATFYIPVLAYMAGNYCYFGHFVLCPVMNVNLFLFFYPKLLAVFKHQDIIKGGLVGLIDRDIVQNKITAQTQINLLKLMLQYSFISIKIWLINMLKSFIGLYQTQWKLYFELGDQANSFFTLSGSCFSSMKAYICQGTICKWLYYLGWYEVIYLSVQYVSACFGALWLLLQHKTWLFFFAISFIVYCALITGPDGSGRFRMMFEPWLLVLAALGLAWIFAKGRKRVFA